MSATVLAIDDSPEVLAALKAWLRPEGIELHSARDWETGLALALEHQPDLILLDVCMPDQSGLDVCRRLKAEPRTEPIPVIFLTAMNDIQTKLHGFDLGASDYITKPFHPDELRARVRTALRSRRERDSLRREARIDNLTGLFNRASFDAELRNAFASALRRATDVSLVMIDLDHFKSINDRYGHPFGDLLLANVGQIMTEHAPARALACRYGGEELALILHEADVTVARGVAEGLRVRIRGLGLTFGAAAVSVSASFGVGSRLSACPTEASVERGVACMIGATDRALYRAKKAGRDRVCEAAAPTRGSLAPAALGQSQTL